MKLLLKNAKMMEMLQQLKPLLSRRDQIGYMAARNYRILSNSLTEYDAFRNALIEKYGEQERDENGVELPAFSIKMGSPQFRDFCEELEPFNNMEHEVELMTAYFDDVAGILSGEEILGIDWMLKDREE